MARRNKELVDLWITVTILVSLSVYHLITSLNESFYDYFRLSADFPERELLSNGLYLWMLGLLLIAYQRWRKVMQSESELVAIMDSTGPAVVLVLNPKRIIKSCNRSIENVFGFSPEDVIGFTTEQLYDDRQTNPNSPTEVCDSLQQVGFHIGEAKGSHKNGAAIDLEIITVENKRDKGTVLLVKDISSRKQSERLILAAKEEAEKTTREKQALLDQLEQSFAQLQKLEASRDSLTHMIVHDMKTPLQVLLLNAELLRETEGLQFDKNARESVDDIISYCSHLDTMMKSMLDASRMEEDKLPINSSPQNLRENVGQAIKLLGAIKGSHTIEVDCPENVPQVPCDNELIQRVLMNLLVNAISFSPGNSLIRVDIESRSHDVKVSIIDQGTGIPSKSLSTVFEKFTQVNVTGHRKSGSTGLGLTFCRLAVEAHGGDIGVESTMGKGSTFWFTLPKSAVDAVA